MFKQIAFEPDDLLNLVVLANPYQLYAQLRSTDPVHWNRHVGAWMLTRHADVIAAFQDPRLLSVWSISAERPPAAEEDVHLNYIMRYLPRFMVGMDGPAYIQQHGLVNQTFTSPLLERLEERIEQIVDDLLAPIRATGRIELIHNLAFPLPSTIILELLGIPPEGHAYVKASAQRLGLANSLPNPASGRLERMAHTIRQVEEYLSGLIAIRQNNPHDDLLSVLASAVDDDTMLNEQNVMISSLMLLFAGHETTTNLIGNGLRALLRNPEQLERLKADSSLITSAIEEILRYDTPMQFAFRIADEDITIHGKTIRKGQSVMLGIGAANRDPEQFADPERFDIVRPVAGALLSFGYGSHFCIGTSLARMEGALALDALLRLPDLRLATDNLEWKSNFLFRSLAALPLEFKPDVDCTPYYTADIESRVLDRLRALGYL